MKHIHYLNTRLAVQFKGSPGSNSVILTFPGGRKNNLWFLGGYRSPHAPPIQADFPLSCLGPRERAQLEAMLSLHMPDKTPILPWRKGPNNQN